MHRQIASSDQPVGLEIRPPIAWLTGRTPPVNALSQPVRQGLLDGLRAASANSKVDEIAAGGEGRTFSCGADLGELEEGIADPGLLAFVRVCGASTKPVIAALQGTVFGGSAVVAHACDDRIAETGKRFAMTKLSPGLLPTCGGTQSLRRPVGIDHALELSIDGRILCAAEAVAWGLIDEIVLDGESSMHAETMAAACPSKRLTRDRGPGDPRQSRRIIDAKRREQRDRWPDFEAPQACLDAIEAGLDLRLEDARSGEDAMFLRLLASTRSRRLRRLFFAQRRLRRCRFDRRSIELRLRACAGSAAELDTLARGLVETGVFPDIGVLEAFFIEALGLPRHRATALVAEDLE